VTSYDDIDGTAPGLRHYLEVLRRRKWIVLVLLAITIGVAAGATQLQEPKYRATMKIVIGQGQGLFSPTLANAFEPFSATMSDLLRSNIVAREVISNLGLDMTEESLLAKMSVSTKPASSALKVSIEDRDRVRARMIAQNIGFVFSELVEERFGQQAPAAPGDAAVPPLTATIWDPAVIEPQPVSPRPRRNLAIAGVLGLILGILGAFVREHFDRALRTRESIEHAFGMPVIGQIPFERARGRREPRAVSNPFGLSAEAYRAVRANLQYLGVKRPLTTILLTSGAPGQGKTTVTANLAAAIARSGASTVVVEGDLRRPRLAEVYGVDAGGPGLTGVLVGNAQLDDAVVTVPLGQGGDDRQHAQLALLPSGYLPPNPSELLSSGEMEKVLTQLRASYDYVLIDSPPLLLVADALELARTVDGVVIIARRNRATRDEAREVRSVVERLDIRLVGAVMTDVEPSASYYGEYRRTRPAAAPIVGEPVVSKRP
jgi:succinoglycan biosynthesis transport protein ExoP